MYHKNWTLRLEIGSEFITFKVFRGREDAIVSTSPPSWIPKNGSELIKSCECKVFRAR